MFTLDIYEDTKGEQRWRFVSGNGKTIGDSSEGYKRQKAMNRTLKRLFSDIGSGKFRVKVNGKQVQPSTVLG